MSSGITLVIGDLHLADNLFPGVKYLQYQFNTIEGILRSRSESIANVVFLGDIFHFRKPDPETIVSSLAFFQRLEEVFQCKFYFIRGNHDTASKSDSGSFTTILDVLAANDNMVVVKNPITVNLSDNVVGHLIPHFESDGLIKEAISKVKQKSGKKNFIFGHFGYAGCLNTAGDADFGLTVNDFPMETILGHIHKPMDVGNVHIVGTPYGTSFQECDHLHRFATISEDGKLDYHYIGFGLRYLAFDLSELEANKTLINDTNFNTMLRVYLNQLTDQNSVDLRHSIMDKYNVSYVDIKYRPLVEKGSEASNFRPASLMFEMDDEFINNYIDDCKSEIPKEKLLAGLKILKDSE